ncbi:MAG: FIST signal transduction protein [Chitinophagales bacterium]
MRSKALSVFSIEELKTNLVNLIETEFQPTLAIAFGSPNFPFREASNIFKENKIEIIGCTTAGEILNASILENSFTVLLLDIDKQHFKIFHEAYDDTSTINASKRLGEIAKETFTNPGIIAYSSGITIDGESIVTNIKKAVEKEIPLYGGLAADNFRQVATYTFTNEHLEEYGLAAIIIDTDQIEMQGMTFSGWNELGRSHTVTKADGNILYEIDGKPALDQFINYFGDLKFQDTGEGEELISVPGQYPLKIERPDGTILMRSILIYNFKEKALILAGAVKEGDEFKFCPTPDFEVVDTTIKKYQEFSKKQPNVDALIMNSCVGRKFSFGPMFEDEIEGIYNIWKKPMVGYMAYGEIGNTGEKQICEFHNVSCALVTLTQK